jgi:GT2 family glycosyltransferase
MNPGPALVKGDGMTASNTIAVLIACYNRRETTLRCLEALQAQKGLPEATRLQVYLLNDGSTDGTGDAVRTRFPEVRVLQGDGQCYWTGGMRRAWEAAAQDPGIRAFFWLNDDTMLDPDALARFLAVDESENLQQVPAIIAGATRDPSNGAISYSGQRCSSRWHEMDLIMVEPDGTLQRCDTMHGNAVWVPHSAYKKLGTFDRAFRQMHGDFDYGLRARKLGIPNLLLPAPVGSCDPDVTLHRGIWFPKEYSLLRRYRVLFSPKVQPLRSWFTLCWRHGGCLWLRYFLGLYAKVFVVWVGDRIRR